MDNLTTQLGPAGMILIPLVAGLVQQLKRVPGIVKLQEKFPVYLTAALGFGIGAAYLMGLTNPAVAGVIIALSACGAYEAVKKTGAQ